MVAKARKSTKDIDPKADEVQNQSTDVLADALGTARDEEPDPTVKTEAKKLDEKAEEPKTEPPEDAADATEESSEEKTADDAGPDELPPLDVQAPQEVAVKKTGFMPVFLGGVVAALLGFTAARTNVVESMLPQSWQLAKETEVNALSTRIDSQAVGLADLSGQVSGLAQPDTTPLETGIAGNTAAVTKLQTTLAALSKDFTDLNARLTTLEKQPISQGVSQAAIDAYERELNDLQTAVANQRSEIESLLSDAKAMEQNAELTAQDALARSAVTRVLSAIDSGAPFDAALADLVSVTGTTAPDSLSTVAARGVTPLIQLQDQFPDAARAALSASRLDDPDAKNGVVAFLSRQLGARSVAPREGSDADAVLSRAGAAINAGRLSDALLEIDALPEVARAEMSEWRARAELRAAAQAAVDQLSSTLSDN